MGHRRGLSTTFTVLHHRARHRDPGAGQHKDGGRCRHSSDRRQQDRRLDRIPLLRPGHAIPRQHLDAAGVHHDRRDDLGAMLQDLTF